MNSKKMLAESLEKLLMKKNLDDIPVSEIVVGTSLSRKTFYRHFRDKYDLASWYFAQFYEASFGRITTGLTWEEALLHYLDIYQEKYIVLKNAYASRDVNGLRAYDISVTKKTYEKYLTIKGADINSETMRFAIDIASCGGTDMVIKWLLSGMKMEKGKLVCLLKQTLPNDILKYID
ncbi:regulatory protein TetR [Ruminiclostridium papyrosolvens DSM 2782]|uniref:Regulatory protein TetR n=1 Tax=Ruminiclostridium papyrosolvens DSM 2782 TaxID=588581 RepID=F1T941_9FIRM|nr:TetR/AcrR family transcriptional regulator C-terminal domain-containing protein [Ruminiclostridium papyrosolvens]EGD49023.1 regulatory protein TetR [Ruminiclostridium papyrosolvens DSM 2782]WES35506.1 TetR/AcrR family transcriptional regulator C-terminal domain-containing protein [Ruminiclostridium papyrosolvens DSM 2782]